MRRRFSFKNDNEHSLIITANSSSTVLFQINAFGDCEYNLNNTGWKIYSQTPFSINAGETIRFRGQLSYSSTTIVKENGIGRFIITGDVDLSGSPMYMLSSNKLAYNIFCKLFYNCTGIKNVSADFLPATTLAEYCYGQMFYGCTSLTTAPQLPATTLADDCYKNMFYNCTSLTTAPELPATTLTTSCYQSMFYNCTSLTTAPELPATTLAYCCYRKMFYGCTSLTTAPELPAKNLKTYCYQRMFNGCTSLITAPKLPATTLASRCYYSMFERCSKLTTAPELPATTLASSCYHSMFSGTNVLPDCSNINFSSSTVVASGGLIGLFAGTKVTDDDLRSILPINSNGKYYLPCTTLAESCYYSMFYDCTSLTTAPELPATTLANQCYYSMFWGCSKLNHIKAMFTTTPSSSYTYSWVSGVASSGTFVKNKNATWNVTGTDGIPSGWTVQTA